MRSVSVSAAANVIDGVGIETGVEQLKPNELCQIAVRFVVGSIDDTPSSRGSRHLTRDLLADLERDEALAVVEATHGSGHRRAALALTNLGVHYERIGRLEEALGQLARGDSSDPVLAQLYTTPHTLASAARMVGSAPMAELCVITFFNKGTNGLMYQFSLTG